MKRLLRGAVSLVTVAVALASAGCGDKSSENTPTGPQLPATGNTARRRQPTSQQPPAVNSGGRVTSMAVAMSIMDVSPWVAKNRNTGNQRGSNKMSCCL